MIHLPSTEGFKLLRAFTPHLDNSSFFGIARVKEVDFLAAASSFFCLFLAVEVFFTIAFVLLEADLFVLITAAVLAVDG